MLSVPPDVLKGATFLNSLLSQEMTHAVRLIAWRMLGFNSSQPSEALLAFLVVASSTFCISTTAFCMAEVLKSCYKADVIDHRMHVIASIRQQHTYGVQICEHVSWEVADVLCTHVVWAVRPTH